MLCDREPEPRRLPWPTASLTLATLSLLMWLGVLAVAGGVIAMYCGWP